jgi:hypothetical protein
MPAPKKTPRGTTNPAAPKPLRGLRSEGSYDHTFTRSQGKELAKYLDAFINHFEARIDPSTSAVVDLSDVKKLREAVGSRRRVGAREKLVNAEVSDISRASQMIERLTTLETGSDKFTHQTSSANAYTPPQMIATMARGEALQQRQGGKSGRKPGFVPTPATFTAPPPPKAVGGLRESGIGDVKVTDDLLDILPRNWKTMTLEEQYEWAKNNANLEHEIDGQKIKLSSGEAKKLIEAKKRAILEKREKEEDMAERKRKREERFAKLTFEEKLQLRESAEQRRRALAAEQEESEEEMEARLRQEERDARPDRRERAEEMDTSRILDDLGEILKSTPTTASGDEADDDGRPRALRSTTRATRKYFSRLSEARMSPLRRQATAGFRSGSRGKGPGREGIGLVDDDNKATVRGSPEMFKQITDALPGAIRSAMKSLENARGDKRDKSTIDALESTVSGLELLQTRLRQRGRDPLQLNKKDTDKILDALIVAIDRAMRRGLDERAQAYGVFMEMLAESAMSTFFNNK